jgi:hypothetical protein
MAPDAGSDVMLRGGGDSLGDHLLLVLVGSLVQ